MIKEPKPRIAVVSPFLDKQHGTELCVAEQVERLADEYEFHVYSTRIADMDTRKFRWHRVPDIPGPHLVKYIWFFCANHLWRWLGRVSGKVDFDLTYSPGINCFDAELIAVHMVFAEFFERVHGNSIAQASQSGSWFRTIHRRLFYRLIILLERQIYARPTLPLIAVSRKVENELKRFYGCRSSSFVVYNGIESSRFKPQVRQSLRGQARATLGYLESDFVLLLIGNDWRTKGLHCLLEAAALLKSRCVKVAVVGRDDISPFRAAVESRGLNSSVQFLPLRPDPELYYAAADAYAGPSLEDAFGIPPLEAMACGLPVIVSRQAGVSELIAHGEDGYILENPQEPRELTSLIAKLCEDKELRQRIGRRAAETARQYTWERNAARFHEILQHVLEKKQENHCMLREPDCPEARD
ncbi:MAG TPA: glycosyltransferase family 4 protein [Candidatus Acidoferrales bacterium]|nr:glycosyltransferase family 4 protein [Candidatus Acidoferrales bacterium]